MEDSRFQPLCDICDGTGDNECDYWMHPREFYGNSILIKNYCDKCVKTFDLYDGRKEKVCLNCLKYVNIFVTNPSFLNAIKKLTIISTNFPSKDWIDDYEPYESHILKENPNVKEAWNFCQLLRKIESFSIEEISKIIKTIDFDKIEEWINQINEF